MIAFFTNLFFLSLNLEAEQRRERVLRVRFGFPAFRRP